MRLLVTGANGQVGWELSRSLMPVGEVVAVGHAEFDLSQPQTLPGLIRELKPAVIVNAAAYTSVDQAEDEERLATTVNSTAVGVLAEEARKAGALLIHYSTDYVFDGAKETPYLEDDLPRPINAYGRSKLAGEVAIRQTGAAYITFRTSWVFAARGRNFLRTVLRLSRDEAELKIVADQVGAPTWARNIADFTAHALRQALRELDQNTFVSGLFHLSASGSTSWHGFATAILEEARCTDILPSFSPRLIAILSHEYSQRAQRPRNSRLATDRATTRFDAGLPQWRRGLTLCIQEIQSAISNECSARLRSVASRLDAERME